MFQKYDQWKKNKVTKSYGQTILFAKYVHINIERLTDHQNEEIGNPRKLYTNTLSV
jgi:hypothetical protein